MNLANQLVQNILAKANMEKFEWNSYYYILLIIYAIKMKRTKQELENYIKSILAPLKSEKEVIFVCLC